MRSVFDWLGLAPRAKLTELAELRAQAEAEAERAKLELLRERVKVETLFAHLPDGLVITNLRGQVLFMNPPAMRIFGLSSADIKAPSKGLVEPADPDKWRMPVQEILKNHTRSEIMELPTGCFRTTVTMFSAPGGGDFGVLLMLRDVTGERRLSALKEEFFQAVAHDLRAPLFAMQGYLRLLEKAVKPAGNLKGYFDAITQSCEKLTLLIQDTLDSARLETGQLTLTAAAVEPEALLQRVVRLFTPIAEEKGLKLDLVVASGSPKLVEADERLLERVFNNLVSNALKFTPRGGTITLEMAPAGPDQVEFAVADTGPGIPAEFKTRVFEKFHQGDDGRRAGGFGLGLNICHKIVELHKGSIWVESEAGLGSQFVFRIPTRAKMEVA